MSLRKTGNSTTVNATSGLSLRIGPQNANIPHLLYRRRHKRNQVGSDSHNFQMPLQREMDSSHSLLEAMNGAGLQWRLQWHNTVARRGNIYIYIKHLSA